MDRGRGRVPARIAWAVTRLDVSGGDEILEIGCGPGVAVQLICARLQTGPLTAIDRSATAIERTRSRNAEDAASGRVVLHQVQLADLQAPPAAFDTVLAVNVNVFWTNPADAECRVLRQVLRPGGRVHLVYEGPGAGGQRDVAPVVATTLERHNFTTEVVRHTSAPMVDIVGVR